MRIGLSLVVLVALCAGCATYEPTLPKDYAGPTATIAEHVFSEGDTKGQLFYIESIDGKEILSSHQATLKATLGRGFSLALRSVEHVVPARPLRLKLVGTHMTGAPIHEMASRAAGTFFRVEGELVFTPQAGGAYFVTGKLQKEGSAVWIADVKSEQPVTEQVMQRK